MVSTVRASDTSSGLYPIRTVSRLTGVNAITLRAWENRYGLIEPIRKESGHRVYTQQHIDLINRVVGLLDRGMRISEVNTFLNSESEESKTQGTGEENRHWQNQIDGMISAIIRFDEEALEAVYNQAVSNHPVSVVTRELIEPLLVELGTRWKTGRGTIAEEHFFGFYLRNKLGARFHHRPRNLGGPKLLMACLPGERHELGLLLFAFSVQDSGYQPVILGADMPLDELPAVANKMDCSGIVLSGFMPVSSKLIDEELPRLLSESSVPVMVGGRTSVVSFDELRKTGVQLLGSDIDAGLKRISELVRLSSH